MVLHYYKLRDVEDPKFATTGSACFDLRLDLSQEAIYGYTHDSFKVSLRPYEATPGRKIELPDTKTRWMLPTGLVFDIPYGYHIAVNVRGGTGLKRGLRLANSTGIIDEDYVEETFMLMQNISGIPVTLEHGERLCQARLVKNERFTLGEIKEKPQQKTDRVSGFNSTGKH